MRINDIKVGNAGARKPQGDLKRKVN
jgi:hypothetical protein